AGFNTAKTRRPIADSHARCVDREGLGGFPRGHSTSYHPRARYRDHQTIHCEPSECSGHCRPSRRAIAKEYIGASTDGHVVERTVSTESECHSCGFRSNLSVEHTFATDARSYSALQ